MCDNRFHTEALSALLQDDDRFGFIIINGESAMFATLSGNTREILDALSVQLPNKHSRGGQSALRFSRLRDEARQNWVRKVSEAATQHFIADNKVNVSGIVLAGSADFKNDLNQSDMFDQRLRSKVLKVVDVAYGGENGFNQAIELAGEVLGNVKFVQEKKLLQKFFTELGRGSDLASYGVRDTLTALEIGAVETLIVFENLDITRWILKSSTTAGSETILHTNKEQEMDRSLFLEKDNSKEMEVLETIPLLEWLAMKYQDFGATLSIVGDRSREGAQFKEMGGIGAILRYRVDFENFVEDDEDEFEDEDAGNEEYGTGGDDKVQPAGESSSN
ncbi:eukaryotic release factor 1 [Lepidopterella palustris CBS 459.81]|uniref:Eukaryotic peptide chain release factor subunit 1 n=1 Tax=Lepidopterella palustris CBS 459.81 TaxID=1314670 RepID=A0A8E2JKL7_9PEZI|nr:eukaryotic release factor 1 [Lepidopterella palustris CBS 459.81]